MSEERPLVGVGLLIVKRDEIILGKRKNSHGSGEYASAGGHMEHLESFEDTALRELREEMGNSIKISNLRLLCISNLKRYKPKHHIDIGVVAEWVSGEPEVMEPNKLEKWGWYRMDDLPKPLFAVIPNYIEAYKTGKLYFPET